MSNKYTKPATFRARLDTHLETLAEGQDLGRLKQRVVFDRLLARLMDEFEDAMVLKGGLALELRLSRARTTKDVDVRFSGDPDSLLSRLQRAGRLNLGDHMTFEISVDPKHPTIDGEGTIYPGRKFKVATKLAGKPYAAQAFPLDVGVGDPMFGTPDEIVGNDYLSFAGVPPPKLRIYPFETHLAEKLHAYTLPRPPDRPNSRSKDLYDIALMSLDKSVDSTRIQAAIEQTFVARGTHTAPGCLPDPPPAWDLSYKSDRDRFQLPWQSLELCLHQARQFMDPVLSDLPASTWEPESGVWRPGPESPASTSPKTPSS